MIKEHAGKNARTEGGKGGTKKYVYRTRKEKPVVLRRISAGKKLNNSQTNQNKKSEPEREGKATQLKLKLRESGGECQRGRATGEGRRGGRYGNEVIRDPAGRDRGNGAAQRKEGEGV